MSETKEVELPKTMLILKSHVTALGTVETFLRNRGWKIFSTANLKEALVQIVSNKPSYVLISVDHPNKKVRALPKLLSQAFPVATIAFAENQSSSSYKILNESATEYRVYPPVTGPAIERCVNKYLKDQQTKATVESANDTFKSENGNANDTIAIKGGGNGHISIKAESGEFGADNASRLFSQFLNEENPGQQGNSGKGDNNLVFAQPMDEDDAPSSAQGYVPGNNPFGSSSQDDISGTAYAKGDNGSQANGPNGFGNTYVQKGHVGQASGYIPPNDDLGGFGKTQNGPQGGPFGSGSQGGPGSEGGWGPQGGPAGQGSQTGPGTDGGWGPQGEGFGNGNGGLGGANANGSGGLAGSSGAVGENGWGTADADGNTQQDDLSSANQVERSGTAHDGMGSREYRRQKAAEAGWAPAEDKDPRLLGKDVTRVRGEVEETLIARGTQKSLEESVDRGDGTVKEKLEDTTSAACILVESERFSGYLVAVMGKNKKIDDQFIETIKQRLFKFLKDNGEKVAEENASMDIKIRQVDFEPWAVEYADFLRKSVHQGNEVVMAFFPRRPVKAILEDSHHKDMAKIELAELAGDRQVEFDLYVYLPTNDKYVLYTPKGGVFYNKQMDRLKKQGVTHMHIQKDAVQAVSKYQAQNYLNDMVEDYEQKQELTAKIRAA